MDQTQSIFGMGAKKIATLALLAGVLVGLTAGGIAGYKYGQKKGENKIKQDLITTTGGSTEINSFYGTIKSISGTDIVVEAHIAPIAFLPEEIRMITVSISDITKFIKQVNKTDEELKADQKAYGKALQQGKSPLPPVTYKTSKLKFIDLRNDDSIQVVTESNVANLTQVTALEIMLLPN